MNKYEYQFELRKLLMFLYDAMIRKDETRIKELKDKIEFIYRTQGLNNEDWDIRWNNQKSTCKNGVQRTECAGEHR